MTWWQTGLVLWIVVSLPVSLVVARLMAAGTAHLDGRGGPPVIGRDARVEGGGVREGEL